MNDITPQDQDPKIQLERRLKDAEVNERKASSEFLELSRPHLVAGRRLPWDNFWSTIAQGFDGILWRWFGSDVEVARAQEKEVQRRANKKLSPPRRENNDRLAQDKGSSQD